MRLKRRVIDEATDPRLLPEMLVKTLDNLDGDALVLAPGEQPIFASNGIERLGILKDGRIDSPELLATIRVVRRTNTKHTGRIDIPRGPIGEGIHELTVNIFPLTEGDLVIVLISDESEAQRVHEIRRDFVANISHELKTPIGALSLLSEAVLGAKDEPEAVTMFATRMQSESRRLTDLVQEIIQLSRVQDSDPLQEAQSLSVNDLLKEALDQCRTTADSRAISLTFAESIDSRVLGDREQLTMAVHNLIENAINYSPEGTTVSITSSLQDSIIDITVTDQGIGIPESEIERIFERFYRSQETRSAPGSGLGLAIVADAVNRHQGVVFAANAKDGGAIVGFDLPEP